MDDGRRYDAPAPAQLVGAAFIALLGFAVLLILASFLMDSFTDGASETEPSGTRSSALRYVSCQTLEDLSGDAAHRREYLSRYEGVHLSLEEGCAPEGSHYLEPLLAAGFRDFVIVTFCPLELSFYLVDAAHGYRDVEIFVSVWEEPPTSSNHNVRVLPSGYLWLPYNDWGCSTPYPNDGKATLT